MAGSPPEQKPAGRAAPHALLVLLFYLALSALLFSATLVAPGERLIFGGVDIREITWFMGWTPFAVGHLHSALLTTYIDYPSGVNLMWNTAMVFPALALWPVTALFGPIVSTNIVISLALALSGFAAYLLARRYVRSQIAAIAAGLVYGFSPWMIARSNGEIHMTIAIFPAVALLALDEILVRQRRSRWLAGAGLGLAAGAELLTSSEILLLTALLALVGMVVLAISHWGSISAHIPYGAQALATAAAVFLLIAAYPLYVQFFGPQRVSGVLPDPYWTDLFAPVVPTRLQAIQFARSIAAQITSRNLNEEGAAYFGIPLLLIGLFVTVRFWSKGIVRVASVVGVTAAVLAMADHLHVRGHQTRIPLPWLLLQHGPMMKNVSPPRFMIFAYLAAALLLAVFVDWALSRPSRGLRLAGIGAVLLALLALFPALPFPTETPAVPSFFRTGEVRRIPQGSVALVAPYSLAFTSDAMMWQSVSGMRFRMPEGYAYRPGPTRNPPPSALQTRLYNIFYGLDRPPLTPDDITQMRADLARMGASTVVVGPEPGRDEVLNLFTSLLSRQPESTGGVEVWWDVR